MAASSQPFMLPPEAAAYLRLSPSTLSKMRLRGTGPAYTKLGERLVGYERQHLEEWLGAHLRRSTSDPGPAPSPMPNR